MDISNGDSSPRISFSDDEGRAFVTPYPEKPKFYAWDKVMLITRDSNGTETEEGPYYIETVIPPHVYTLCNDKGKSAKNGVKIQEVDLKLSKD